MDHYMKSICTPFLTAAISETIHKLMESKQSCEVIKNNERERERVYWI